MPSPETEPAVHATPVGPRGPMKVVPLTSADAERVLAVDQSAFFFDPSEIVVERETAHFEWPRTFGAAREGEPALGGLYTSYPMQVSAPGPLGCVTRLPMAGLSWVSVHPDERRRGVLRSMIGHHFQRLHEDGEYLSGLHAAEVGIYGRFGYAVASLEVSLELARGTTFTAPELDDAAAAVDTRFSRAEPDAATVARIQDIHARAALANLGTVTRSDLYLRSGLVDRPFWRRGREPKQVMFATVEGRPTGFAIFQRSDEWEAGQPNGELKVGEMAAVDAPSLLALARRLVDFDLVAKTQFRSRSLDDPLIWWTGSPRGAGLSVHDGLWLRLVDVDQALVARGYASACSAVIDVVDEVCPWNAGRWRLEVGAEGRATCVRTEDDADVRLPVQALAAAYLGSRTLLAQRFSGSVQELVAGSLLPLSRAMSSDREPIGSIDF